VCGFSPAAINRYLGKSEVPEAEVEAFDNMICKEITGGQVSSGLGKENCIVENCVKYPILNRIGAAN